MRFTSLFLVAAATVVAVAGGMVWGQSQGGGEVTLLAEGTGDEGDWRLVAERSAREGLCVVRYGETREGGACGLAEHPPTLDESSSWLIDESGRETTYVAGAVPDEADTVELVTGDGQTVTEPTVEGPGARVYVLAVIGRHSIAEMTARDKDGRTVATRSLPESPPAGPPDIPEGEDPPKPDPTPPEPPDEVSSEDG